MPPIQFEFRIWTFAADICEEPLLEAWVSGFETIVVGERSFIEWAVSSLWSLSWSQAFQLDTTKCWQIVGQAMLTPAVPTPQSLAPAEDKLEILFYDKQEVPKTYHYAKEAAA